MSDQINIASQELVHFTSQLNEHLTYWNVQVHNLKGNVFNFDQKLGEIFHFPPEAKLVGKVKISLCSIQNGTSHTLHLADVEATDWNTTTKKLIEVSIESGGMRFTRNWTPDLVIVSINRKLLGRDTADGILCCYQISAAAKKVIRELTNPNKVSMSGKVNEWIRQRNALDDKIRKATNAGIDEG
ncbi:hypothetical protein KA013_01185 [Patescibacteria group bacterium]|nr:hypothetical protein [Patescibacteria group bacterium]